jgi:uncharacterized protein YheU (UPF0270 family)
MTAIRHFLYIERQLGRQFKHADWSIDEKKSEIPTSLIQGEAVLVLRL